MDKKVKKYRFAILGSDGHGKTTLHEAIQKVTELLNKQEISIYPDCISENTRVSELISILSQVDTVIIVISAYHGLNPKIREYALLSRQFGIDKMIVYINKEDQIDNKYLVDLQTEVFDLMTEYYYDKDSLWIYNGSAIKLIETAKEYETILRLIN